MLRLERDIEVFVAVGVFRLPLLWAVAIFGPLSVAFMHFRRKS